MISSVMMKFPFGVSRTALLWFCVTVMLRFLSRTPVFLVFPPPLLLASLNLPCRLAADALLDMVNSDLRLLLLQIDTVCTQEGTSHGHLPAG
jgi:hypothetical protein